MPPKKTATKPDFKVTQIGAAGKNETVYQVSEKGATRTSVGSIRILSKLIPVKGGAPQQRSSSTVAKSLVASSVTIGDIPHLGGYQAAVKIATKIRERQRSG